MIRPAGEADLPLILDLGAAMHAAMDKPAPYDPASVEASTRDLMERGTVLVADRGMVGGFVYGAFWNAAHKVAAEVFWWAEDGQAMALLAAFEGWARQQGAAEMLIGTQHAYRGAAVGRLLRRGGYAMSETYWTKGLIHG